MALHKLLAFYTCAAMIAGVIMSILLINQNFDIKPVTAVSALLISVPVLAYAILGLGKAQQY